MSILQAAYELSLRARIELVPIDWRLLNEWATTHHYMHKAVHPRSCPFGWGVKFDGQLYQPDGAPSGFITYASVSFPKLHGEFGYPGLPTCWQVLDLKRLHVHQALPKLSESVIIGRSLRMAPRAWLKRHPPPDLSQPYEICKVISFCDLTAGFTGTVYEAANFRAAGETVSKPRHKNTRGSGMDGHTLRRYFYDVPERRAWAQTVTAQLALFAEDEMPDLIPFFMRWWKAWQDVRSTPWLRSMAHGLTL